MAKKKTSLRAKAKQIKLNAFQKRQIKQIAAIKKKNLDTPKKIENFYKKNKQTFDNYFSGGATSFPAGSSRVFQDLDIAKENGYTFYIEKGKKLEKVTANELKMQIALTESWLNRVFDATGSAFKYRITNDGKIIAKFPKREEQPEILEEDSEVIVDFLADEYNINVYLSSPKTSKRYKQNEEYRDEYKSKIKFRLKQLRGKKTKTDKKRIKRK